MPTSNPNPKNLRPYLFHGVHFHKQEEDEWDGDCPFCGRENKFGVKVENGVYHCVVCGEGGNSTTFLRKLHEAGVFPDIQAGKLRESRGFLATTTLETWGLVLSPITTEWLFPAYGPKGSLDQLYRYGEWKNGEKRSLRGTTEVDHALFGYQLYDPNKSTVYICESWNAPALWEVLRITKLHADGRLVLTGSESISLAADANVIGVPGANVWKDRWSPLFAGKKVILVTDNDHPQPHPKTGKMIEGAGVAGAKRTAAMLAACPEAPESIYVTMWGEGGVDLDKPSGFDIRDLLTVTQSPVDRVNALSVVLGMVEPIPEDWVAGRSSSSASSGNVHLEPMKCEKWSELINTWKKALKWSGDLEDMLSTCLASILSTETQGEQIWVLVMAPPSSGKTTICEALGVAREYVHAKSILGKVYSGYKIDKEGSEDFGDIPLIKNKTLVVKEGDTLLKDPNRAMIMSQYRDLYDGAGRMKFNNGLSFNHEGLRFTMIICGTASMREMDSAEFGSRYIVCSFSEHENPEHEREVGLRVVHRAFRNVRMMANGKPETRSDPDMTLAKQMTGGYVIYLRRHAEQLMNSIEIDEDLAEKIAELGEFVAFFRTRQPKLQDEVVEREKPYRIQEQFARLSVCLAAAMGKKEVDEVVLKQVRRRALDTSRGRTLNYARAIFEAGDTGTTVSSLHGKLGESDDKVKAMLEFLFKIGVVEKNEQKQAYMVGRTRWKLTERIKTLYEEVCGAEA